jgi:hypothetical protein
MCRFRKPLIAERVAGDRPPGAVAARGKIREGGEPSSSTLLKMGSNSRFTASTARRPPAGNPGWPDAPFGSLGAATTEVGTVARDEMKNHASAGGQYQYSEETYNS